MADEHTIRRHNGWEIRNADGLYWHDYEKKWLPVGMRWLGHSRRDMQRMARAVGGTLVRLTLVRRTKAGRSAVRCSECRDTQAEIAALRTRAERYQEALRGVRTELTGALHEGATDAGRAHGIGIAIRVIDAALAATGDEEGKGGEGG